MVFAFWFYKKKNDSFEEGKNLFSIRNPKMHNQQVTYLKNLNEFLVKFSIFCPNPLGETYCIETTGQVILSKIL